MAETATGSFIDHPRKVIFRTYWAKPILKLLSEKLKKKLVYLGLPGIKALDIKEWQEYLKIVVAFQCKNYNEKSEEEEIEQDELISFLNGLEEKSILETYSLYTGYIEQVVMGGKDDNDLSFTHSDYITVYNLDFCNTLATPYPVVDNKGNTRKCYKMDVIDKLLSFEKESCLNKDDSCFVMFLTVNALFFENLVIDIPDDTIQAYIKKNLKGTIKERRIIRLLRAYTCYYLKEHFKKYGFHIEILPTIHYRGTGEHWLLTFTVIGTPMKVNEPPLVFDQSLKTLLEQKFIFLTDKEICCHTEEKGGIVETDVSTKAEEILANSYTMQSLLKPILLQG